jgi:phosphopantetheinyl transferase (holo-ACP synthase)
MKIIELRGRGLIVFDVGDAASWFDVVPDFPREKRRLEWMLSRIAEKELRKRGAQGDYVSYSHSGKYGAAAIDAQPVGIDVEVLRNLSESAARHFLNDDEIAAMERCTIANRMLHFWSAKEAVWKQRGGAVPTLKRIRIQLEAENADGLRFDGVETFAIGDLVAALTMSSRA